MNHLIIVVLFWLFNLNKASPIDVLSPIDGEYVKSKYTVSKGVLIENNSIILTKDFGNLHNRRVSLEVCFFFLFILFFISQQSPT